MSDVLVRLGSHRAADRLARLLGTTARELDWHFTWVDGGDFVLIPTDRLADARKIPGVTKARPTGVAHRCYRP